MVAELVRASYLIDTLTDPKVEGSNPGIVVPFLGRQFSSKNDSRIRDSRTNAHGQFSAHAHATSTFGDDVIYSRYMTSWADLPHT